MFSMVLIAKRDRLMEIYPTLNKNTFSKVKEAVSYTNQGFIGGKFLSIITKKPNKDYICSTFSKRFAILTVY